MKNVLIRALVTEKRRRQFNSLNSENKNNYLFEDDIQVWISEAVPEEHKGSVH